MTNNYTSPVTLAFSYTLLDSYDNCPEQVRQIYVLRQVKKVYSAQATDGIDAHRELEKRIKEKTPLPAALASAEPFVASFEKSGNVEAEVSLAVDAHLRPVSFWGGSGMGEANFVPLLRGKFDVVIRNAPLRRAFIGDWKTGKVREKSEQLEIGALLLMENDPTIDLVTGANIWLSRQQLGTPYIFTRETKALPWAKLMTKMRAIEARDRNVEWDKRASPLCNWCPVVACEHNPGWRRA